MEQQRPGPRPVSSITAVRPVRLKYRPVSVVRTKSGRVVRKALPE